MSGNRAAVSSQLLLASASPRRAELLKQIGIRFRQHAVDVDETAAPGEAPADYVTRLALAKARVGHDAQEERSRLPCLGADTAVIVDGDILGKPRDRAHGLAMLARLSGNRHQVFSAVAVVAAREQTALQVSAVVFREIGEAERRAYWGTGEPADKAGAYAIQGQGAVFVESISGSYSGVMGLPLFETAALLARAGIPVLGNAVTGSD